MVALLVMSTIDANNAAEVLPVDKGASYCTPYQLGDTGPEKGKIFYVDDSGCHGLEAKATDEINTLSWKDAYIAANIYGSGWHLPTKIELKVLYEHRNRVGGFAKDDYWSSTELDINSAWIQGFGNGDQDRYNKYSRLSVRAVRKF
ncbi:MAG: DUF1566 domain-containing protein [Methylococcaceae bacterium]|nr:DUF1566 domain-containing protein [Methylococcaceae bacterium]